MASATAQWSLYMRYRRKHSKRTWQPGQKGRRRNTNGTGPICVNSVMLTRSRRAHGYGPHGIAGKAAKMRQLPGESRLALVAACAIVRGQITADRKSVV